MLITTPTNLDYLIGSLQMHYGDYDGSQYSESVYRTALVNGVKYLSKKWGAKYYIDEDNNIVRNTSIDFRQNAPPLILPEDEYAIILAATIILRQVKLTSSADSFTSWQTPDLSVSSGSKERVFVKMYEQSIKDLDDYFSKGLAKSIKRFMLLSGSNTYPVASGEIDPTPGAANNT